MSAYDTFLAETKTQAPTGQPKVVPVSVGDQSQPEVAPTTPSPSVAPTSAYERFQVETGVKPAPSVTPAPVVATNPKNQGFLDWYDNNVVKKSNTVLAPVASGLFNSLASMAYIPQDLLRYSAMAQKAIVGSYLWLPSKVSPTVENVKKASDNFFDGVIKTVEESRANPDSIPNKVTSYVQKQTDILKKQNGVDPQNETFGQQLEEGVGSMLSFVALGGLVSKAFGLLGTAEKVATIGGEAVMTLTEASQERQGTYQQVLQDTGDAKLAEKKADTTFFANVALIGITNRFSHYLDKGSRAGQGIFGLIKDSLTSATSEGSQEGLQQIIQNYSAGKPILQGVTDNTLIGAILGAGTHVTTRPFITQHNQVDFQKFRDQVIKENKDNPAVQAFANSKGGDVIDPNSAYGKFAQEKGVDLSKPAIEIQKQIEQVNAPQGTIPAEGIAPLEGVNPKNEAKITYEQATPIADKATERYWSEKIQPEIDNGKPIVIGADDLKDHFNKDYNDNNHPIYSQTAYKLFELALQRTKGDTVVLTAGGAGSGKTEIVTKNLIRSGFNGIVYDSNLANYDGAVKQIELAKKAGKKVEIRGVLPNLESSRTFTIQRENKVGRGISDATFARGHAGFPAVLEKLLANGIVKERDVKVLDTRNVNTLEKAFEMVYKDEYVKDLLDTLKNLGYNEDNIKTTYAKNNFNQTTGQRTNGEVPTSEGSRITPSQNRTDKGTTNRGANGDGVPSTREQRKEKLVTKGKKKTYDTLHRGVSGKPEIISKVATSEGEILGNQVFTYKNDNGKYIVIDKKTGLSLSNNVYSALRTSIEKEKAYLIDKAGGEEKLKAMFKTAYERADKLNVTDQPTGSSGYASIGRYRENGDIKLGNIEQVKPIEFPELLSLAKELSGNIPFIKKYTRANGMFYPRGTGDIGLNPDLFTEGNLGQLQKTFAHEIGHLIDYLPDQTMARGNVLGRLAVLKGFNKDFYAGAGATRTNAEVKSQLWELSKYWKPVDEATAPDSFLSYRKSAPEVYADFISVLFNNPVLASEKAPTAYNVFFEQLDKKPEVKKAYFELQDFLRNGEKVMQARKDKAKNMFVEADQKAKDRQNQIELEEEMKKKSLWFKFKFQNVSRFEAVRELVKEKQKRGEYINPDDNPVYYLEESNYLGGHIKSIVDEKFNSIYQELQKNGLDWDDLGEITFYERILKGDRGEVANPEGLQIDFVRELYDDAGVVPADEKTSKEGSVSMKTKLGAEKFAKLQSLAIDYRKGIKELYQEAHREGMISDDAMKMINESEYYVPFKPVKYAGIKTNYRIKSKKGTLQPIENPANTGIEKSVSLIRAIERNKVNKKTIEFLVKNHSNEIEEAKYAFNGKTRIALEPLDKNLRLVTYMDNGKMKAYYVDQYIGEALRKTPVGHSNMILEGLRFMHSGLFRPLFITFNVGFQEFNLIRDYWRSVKSYPNISIIKSLYEVTKNYSKSYRASKIRAFGLPENPTVADREAYDLVNKLERDRIIAITYNDILKGQDAEDRQIDKIMTDVGVRKAEPTRIGVIGDKLGITKKSPIIKQMIGIMDFIENTGNLIETMPKIAGYYALDGKVEPREMASFIRRKVGSPDFLDGGRFKPVINEVFLFSNAIFQGVRADYELAVDPKTRSGYWWKTMQMNFLPKILMLMATYGLFGDWLKELFGKVSEYDKTNYIVVPLGKDENDKAIYVRIPQDETGRLLSGLLWKVAGAVQDPKKLTDLETFTNILSYAGGQAPSLSPVITSLMQTGQFISGQNPYDFFRGRTILSDEQMTAGGAEKWKPFLSYMFDNMGGSVFMKLYKNEVVPKDPSLSERVVGLPAISNLYNRFIRVSDYGETEKIRAVSQEVRSENAKEALANRRVVFDYVDQAQGKPRGEQEAIKREMIKEILGTTINTPEERQKKSSLEKRFNTLLIRGGADPKIDSLVTAQSTEEKVALLTEYQKTMSKEKFEELRKFVITNRVVSSDAYRAFIVNNNKK